MTFAQAAIVGLLLCMFAAYASERVRIELVAVTGLGIAFLAGLVPVDHLFSGFSNPAVITVIEILLVVSVLARTRAIERVAALIVGRLRSERAVLVALCGAAALVSVFMNNIGALALMFPVTLSVCTRLGLAPGRMPMPLSFATLLGGLCSLTGTPANLIVNDWKIAETGGAFGYFAFGSVGLPVAVAGIAWLAVSAPFVFRRMRTDPQSVELGPGAMLAELDIPLESPLAGKALADIERRHALTIHGVVRRGAHVFARRDAIIVEPGDVLLGEAAGETIDALAASGAVTQPGGAGERLEAVVMPDSVVIGSRVESLESFSERGVAVVGLASRRRRIEGRFGDLQIGLGDVLLLAGGRQALRETASDAGLLPLMPRARAAAQPGTILSAAIFLAGVLVTAIGLAPPEVAFGGVVLAMALTGALRLSEALQDVNWTIVILLACMIPLGVAVQDTGAATVIANAIVGHLPTTQPALVTATVLLLAAAITPFVDNVSVAAVLSPVAAGIATRAGMPIEPLLVAVAIGASLDFLTPFGHHNNAVVMGAAGYRFTDFPRLGLPLLGICLVVAMAALGVVWL